MKKIIFVATASLLFIFTVQAQKKTVTEKAVETAEKANKKAHEISNASSKVTEQAKQVGQHAQNITNNAKAIYRVIEPILQHFKRKKKSSVTNPEFAANTNNAPGTNNNGSNRSEPPGPPVTGTAKDDVSGTYKIPISDYGIPENKNYNSDGTANWGNQNSQFPNYLDAFSATIIDAYEAELHPVKVDLIFLADQYGGYMLASPVFLKNSDPGFHYENVVKEWAEVNESEVALTKLTIGEFEKIKWDDANKFYSIVKQTRGYASFYQSFEEKLKGKVFSVRSEMGGRKAYALIAIIDQIGTYGSSGYLKVKIKGVGIDNNADGYADDKRFESH